MLNTLVIPTNYGEKVELKGLTGMDSAVVGVAGGEVSLRWLAEVKNTMNTARRRNDSGELPANFGTAEEELGGGAALGGEKGRME
jgi:hypothetical protein